MKRVAIIGSGGAGKTTLARALGAKIGIPVVHLDRLYWSAGWVPTPRETWLERQREVLEGERWIIDGNYGSTLDLRLEAADTVIFLDTPRLRCFWRVFRRRLTYVNRTRPDIYERGQPGAARGRIFALYLELPAHAAPGDLAKAGKLTRHARRSPPQRRRPRSLSRGARSGREGGRTARPPLTTLYRLVYYRSV